MDISAHVMHRPNARRWLQAAVERLIEPRRHREAQTAEALRIIAASVRAGRSLTSAVHDAAARTDGRTSEALVRAGARMKLGVSPARALSECAHQLDVDAWRIIASVVAVQHRSGGDLAATCQRVARLLHDRGRLAKEAASLTAQSRFTARAVLLMPLIGLMLWAWRSPASLGRMTTPGMLLAVAPACVSIALGVIFIRRWALRGASVDADHTNNRHETAGSTGRLMRRIVGDGTIEHQVVRGLLAGLVPSLLLMASMRSPSMTIIMCSIVAPTCGALWPVLDARRARDRLGHIVDAGICELLEISLAMLTAGASPREVIVAAVAGCPGTLGELLRDGAASMELGRTPASAIGSLDVVRASASLEAWLHALTTGAEHGAPAVHVLETLLRDARAHERELIRTRAATIGPRIQLAVVIFIVPAVTWLVLLATASGLAGQLRSAGILA